MMESAPLGPFYEADLGEAPVALGWSACGQWLAVINVNSEVLVVAADSGTELKRWTAHESGALALVWHPTKPIFASSCQKGVVKIWEVSTGQDTTLLAEITPHDSADSTWIECISWRPDGAQLAIATGSTVRLTSIAGETEDILPFPGGTVAALAWHPGGSLLGLAGYGGISIYNTQEPGERVIELKWKGSLLSLTWSPDGRFIVAGCQDNTVHLWRFGSRKDAMMSGFQYKPLQLTWVNGGKRLMTGGSTELVFWPFDKKGPEGRTPETRSFHEQAICALAVAANGKSIASGSRDGRVAIWKSSRETEPNTWTQLDSRVEQLHWCPAKQSTNLAAISRHGTLSIFDASRFI